MGGATMFNFWTVLYLLVISILGAIVALLIWRAVSKRAARA
jgi:uncharacterized membrane protein YeaQ/YmgE (transglycosylase-associated protein family)